MNFAKKETCIMKKGLNVIYTGGDFGFRIFRKLEVSYVLETNAMPSCCERVD